MWTQIETSWAAMTGKMRSNVPELGNPRIEKPVLSSGPAKGLEASQAAEPDTSLTVEPLLD